MDSRTLVIRADASVAMGTGHVMRCLALSQAWQDAGGDAVFAMCDSTPALRERLASEQIEVVEFSCPPGGAEDAGRLTEIARERRAEWVAVDGYQFRAEYQQKIKDAGSKLLFVDDNGHAAPYCADLILNQNVHAGPDAYRLREPQTRLLLGARYALLRRQFESWRGWEREVASDARRVLVTMGGSDPDNVTAAVVHALPLVKVPGLEATVVVGGSNPHLAEIERAAAHFAGALRLQRNASNMPELIADADVAVSGAGSTCAELCLLGLPAILIDLAENQRPVADELDRTGVSIHLGNSGDAFPEEIAGSLESLLQCAEKRAAMSQRARALVDGRGAQRVLSAMLGRALSLRPVEQKDCRLLWEWANDPAVRAAAFSTAPIPWDVHQKWFACRLQNRESLMLIGEDPEGTALGQFRVDWRSDHEGDIDVSLARTARGNGFGPDLIDLGVRKAFARPAAERVHAYIRPENHASISAFERARFCRAGEKEVNGQPVLHYVRTRPTR